MIIRLYILFGIAVLAGTGYFIVVQQPPTVQTTPAIAEVSRLQQEGVLPVGDLAENEEVGHGIFEVPEMDEAMLEAAMANMDMGDMDMGDMDMGDMDMGGTNMDGMDMAEGEKVLDMDMDGDGVMDMSSADMANEGGSMDKGDMDTGGMDMAEGEKAPDMDMDGDAEHGDEEMTMGGDAEHGEGGMDIGGDADHEEMAMGEDAPHGEEAEMAQRMAGLLIHEAGDFDREIELSMSDWTFSDLELDAKPGERIRFRLRNDGTVLHEFMFMSMAGMQAVNYRARRADWSLLEHEALYEKSLLLPGQELVFIAEVLRPGAWMFMCMLPYHMQMGMMGQLATPGMAMQM